MRTYCEICEEVKEVEQNRMVCWKHVCEDCYYEVEKFLDKLKERKKNEKNNCDI